MPFGRHLFNLGNVLVGLVGIAISACGVVMFLASELLKPYIEDTLTRVVQFSHVVYGTNLSEYVRPFAIALIVIGGLFFILAIVACALSLANKRSAKVNAYLVLYAFMIVLLFAFFTCLTLLFAAPTMTIGPLMHDYMNKTLVEQYVSIDSTDGSSLTWNFIQLNFGCCGVENGADYKSANRFNRKWLLLDTRKDDHNASKILRMKVPPSCCTSDTIDLAKQAVSSNGAKTIFETEGMADCIFYGSSVSSNYNKSCYNTVFERYNKYQWYILGPVIGISVILIFSFSIPIFYMCDEDESVRQCVVEPEMRDRVITLLQTAVSATQTPE